MMMLIIFLITDISMVGIFAGVYGNIAKYREGMLMGVHIPKSELEHPNVKELLQLYKKRNRQFYLWNMLAGIAVCLLCFTYFSIFITVWTLWFVEFCLLTILRVYHYHQKVYDIKQKNGWISSANADVSAAVDTRTSSQIAKKILPAKLHLIPAAVILIPLFFPLFLLRILSGRPVSETAYTAPVPSRPPCHEASPSVDRTEACQLNPDLYYLVKNSDDDIFKMEKRLYTIFLFVSNICNTGAYLGIIRDIASSNWIGGVGMGIYIFLELIPAAIILIMFFWLRKEKERILSQDSTPFYIDDDYYWRKGWYNNPNDKRYFVQDRVNSMNYSLNYGHPSAKYVTGGMLVGTGLLLLWMCILCIRIDFTPIRLTENAAQYSITSGYKTATFALADVESVTLLDNLPDEKFYRSDGSEDNSKLLGNFRGSETGHCQMYIWIEHPPVLQIKTTDTTIFLNSSNEAQTKEWYDQLNDAISSNK